MFLLLGELSPNDILKLGAMIEKAVSTATSGMIHWGYVTAASASIFGVIATLAKIVWGKYQEAVTERDNLQTKINADAKIESDKERIAAKELIAEIKTENDEWLEKRDALAKEISDKKNDEIKSWSDRYFALEKEIRDQVLPVLESSKVTNTKIKADMSKFVKYISIAISENSSDIKESIRTREEAMKMLAKMDKHSTNLTKLTTLLEAGLATRSRLQKPIEYGDKDVV